MSLVEVEIRAVQSRAPFDAVVDCKGALNGDAPGWGERFRSVSTTQVKRTNPARPVKPGITGTQTFGER